MAPTIQIEEPARPLTKPRTMEHKRWKSEPVTRRREMVQPFAYEYKFEDGRLAGLAEYHPDDYAHYSSRTTSKTASTAQSLRSSREEKHDLPNINIEDSTSFSSHGSHTSQAPPPSPRKGDALKRALTLHGLKRRASSEVKKTPPSSPYARPEFEKLAASFGRRGPQHITSPMPTLPPPKPNGMFEQPRAAPRPPSRASSKASPRPEPSPRLGDVSLGHAERAGSTNSAALVPRPQILTPPLSPKEQTPPTSQEDGSADNDENGLPGTQNAKVTRRPPPLRRQPSKFIEHIELKEKLSPRTTKRYAEIIPPVPPMMLTAVEFNLPIQGAIVSSPPPLKVEIPYHDRTPPTGPESPTIGYIPLSHQENVQPIAATSNAATGDVRKPDLPGSSSRSTSSVLKRSSSVMKSTPLMPSRGLARSSTTKSRPTPMMSDVCMAQMKPVLTSGIVAQGHARMISC